MGAPTRRLHHHAAAPHELHKSQTQNHHGQQNNPIPQPLPPPPHSLFAHTRSLDFRFFSRGLAIGLTQHNTHFERCSFTATDAAPYYCFIHDIATAFLGRDTGSNTTDTWSHFGLLSCYLGGQKESCYTYTTGHHRSIIRRFWVVKSEPFRDTLGRDVWAHVGCLNTFFCFGGVGL